MIYFICFLISGIFFWRSECRYNKKQYKISGFLAVGGILILSLLAGFRANSIGTDVMTYVVYAFNRIKDYSNITQVFQKHNLEIGYELLIFICTRISKDIHFLHFITSLIINGCFYSFLKQFSKDGKINIFIGMMVFMCMYFNTSLNIVRQFLAISIILFGVKYLFKEKYIKFLLTVLVAIQFHKSAIIGFGIFVLYKILNTKKQKKSKIILSVAVVCIGLYFLERVMSSLYNLGYVSSQYMGYLSGAGNSSVFMQLLSRAPILILALFLYERLVKRDIKNQLLFSFFIIDCILGCTAPILGDASRISLYFGVWQCALISELVLVMQELVEKKGKPLITLFMNGYLFIFWFYSFVFRNMANTYPYISDLFNR